MECWGYSSEPNGKADKRPFRLYFTRAASPLRREDLLAWRMPADNGKGTMQNWETCLQLLPPTPSDKTDSGKVIKRY